MRVLLALALLILSGCKTTSHQPQPQAQTPEAAREPGAAPTFRIDNDLLQHDRQVLLSLGLVTEASLRRTKFELQEMVSDFTQDALNPAARPKLRDESFVAMVAKPKVNLGPKYFIGVVHFLDGRTEVRQIIRSKDGNKNYLTLGVGFTFLFKAGLSREEQAKVLDAVKSIAPDFTGSFWIPKVLKTDQELPGQVVSDIHAMIARGIAGVGPKLEVFEIFPIRYQLPSPSERIALRLPVEDLRTQMAQFKSITGQGIHYKVEPVGIRPYAPARN